MSLRAACIFAFVAGFISLSCEILWFRVYSYLTGGSPVTFGLLLGIYLAGLAVGAEVAGRLCSSLREETDRLSISLLVSALVADIAAFFVAPAIAFSAQRPDRGWIALVSVMVTAAAFGTLLPLVSHRAIHADRSTGEKLSYIYAANIGGCVTGSLFTGFVLMDMLSTQSIALAIALAGLILVPLAAARRQKVPATLVAVAAAVVLTAIARPAFDRLYEKLQYKDAYRGQRFAHLVENRHGVVAVTDSAITFGGGVYDGAISTNLVNDPNGIERAYALAMLHSRPSHVLMIGLSTGAWAQVIASMQGVDTLTIVEINPGYLGLIGKYSAVASLLQNPKVKIVIDDGRRWLVHNRDRRFDAIVSNTTFHNRSNSTNLLSIEFMRLVRDHLRPGGVFYFNTTGSQDAMKTAFSLFPAGMRVINFVAASDSSIRIDPGRWKDLLASWRIDGRALFDRTDPGEDRRFQEVAAMPSTLRSRPSKLGLESRESVLARIPEARVITDDNMLPEWRTLILHSDGTAWK